MRMTLSFRKELGGGDTKIKKPPQLRGGLVRVSSSLVGDGFKMPGDGILSAVIPLEEIATHGNIDAWWTNPCGHDGASEVEFGIRALHTRGLKCPGEDDDFFRALLGKHFCRIHHGVGSVYDNTPVAVLAVTPVSHPVPVPVFHVQAIQGKTTLIGDSKALKSESGYDHGNCGSLRETEVPYS